MSIPAVVFHHRWSLPILAELHERRGAKFVTLSRRLGVGRDTLRQTLDALQEASLVRRHPGHGHPLRPEYVLTEHARGLGPSSRDVVDVLRREGLLELGLRKWSIPVLLGLRDGDRHFGDLRTGLDVSPRALALALKDLTRARLVERDVHEGFPPTTSYRLTALGDEIARHASRLSGSRRGSTPRR